jgi:hypothetical protein
MSDNDPTEEIRRQQQQELNEAAGIRQELEARHSKVWSTEELREEFEVLGFMAPIVVVKRKSDGKKGSLQFQHSPRFYFNFVED